MELQAVTGQLYILNGEAQPSAAVPGILAQPAPAKAARGRERDYLFVHLTLSGQLEETADLYQDMLAVISANFYQLSGSVTAALRKAILVANDLLLRRNLSGDGLMIEGAVTAAALRNDELFMTQAGDCFACIGHNFGVERLPPRQPAAITPLGRTAGLDFRYFHHRLEEENNLLLCDPRLAHLSAQDFEPALMEADVEDGLFELTDLVGDGTARLLLVALSDDPPVYIPEATDRALVVSPVAAAPEQTAGAAPTAATPPRSPQLPTSAVNAAQLEQGARRASVETARGLARAAGGLANVLGHMREPADEDAPPPTVGDWAWPALVAVLIPILVTLIVTGVYFRWGQVQRFTEIKQEMNQRLILANDVSDETVKRTYLQEALALAVEAEEMRGADGDITRMRRQALAQLDRLDNVSRLTTTLLNSYGTEANLRQVVAGEESYDGLYLLDAGQDRVLRHQMDDSRRMLVGEPETIIFRGQPIVTHLATRMTGMMWRPQGAFAARSGLSALDVSGGLITYYPNQGDRRFVPLGLASQWQRPSAIANFSERLYILDNPAATIWKYYPEGEGFQIRQNDDRIDFGGDEAAADLAQVVDFAIYQDGSVLLLYRGGDLRRYGVGRLLWDGRDLAQNGLTQPMVAPTAVKIIGRGLNASIYALDPGSGRLLQFSLGGMLLAQYKASDADGRELLLQAVDFDVVHDPPLRVYLITGDSLYLLTQN